MDAEQQEIDNLNEVVVEQVPMDDKENVAPKDAKPRKKTQNRLSALVGPIAPIPKFRRRNPPQTSSVACQTSPSISAFPEDSIYHSSDQLVYYSYGEYVYLGYSYTNSYGRLVHVPFWRPPVRVSELERIPERPPAPF